MLHISSCKGPQYVYRVSSLPRVARFDLTRRTISRKTLNPPETKKRLFITRKAEKARQRKVHHGFSDSCALILQ